MKKAFKKFFRMFFFLFSAIVFLIVFLPEHVFAKTRRRKSGGVGQKQSGIRLGRRTYYKKEHSASKEWEEPEDIPQEEIVWKDRKGVSS